MLLPLLASLFLACLSFPALSATLWFSNEHTLYHIDSETHARLHTLKLDEVEALSADKAGGAWVINGKKLTHLGADGVTLLTLELKAVGLKEADHLAVNAVDGSIWVADEKTLLHLDVSGQIRHPVTIPENLRHIVVALDHSVWLLGNKQLLHYSATGIKLKDMDLKGLVKEEPKTMLLDDLHGYLWLASEKALTQLDLANLNLVRRDLKLDKKAEGFTLDPKTGTLWLTSKDQLLAYDQNGLVIKTFTLEALNLSEVETLAFDATSNTLWLADKKNLIHLTTNGERLNTLAASIEHIAPALFTITPLIKLINPLGDVLTNNPTPRITVGYDAICITTPCGLKPAYFSTYTLIASLSGNNVSALFNFDPITGQANYTPVIKLSEGVNLFSAQARDSFGQMSNTVNASITIDTVPPMFLNLSPADGSVITGNQVTVQGKVDDVGALVTLENLSQWNGIGQNPAIQNFSYQLTLKPGLNTIQLSAIDPAGNIATQTLRLTYTPNALTLTLLSPVSGTAVSDDQMLVSGTFQGPLNTGITVNGVVAAISNNQFYATVPLNVGTNTLTVIATTADGTSVTKTVDVTSSGAGPITVTAEPKNGVAPLQTGFTVTNNTANVFTKIEADFNNDGVTDFTAFDITSPIEFTYVTPGVYQAKFMVTDSLNNVYTKTVLVTVQDAAQMDQLFKSIWDGTNSALVAKDKAKALRYLNRGAQAKYEPVFEALLPDFPTIIASYSALQRVSISDDIGEYAINRSINGVDSIFFIYFLKDGDGVWRLDSM